MDEYENGQSHISFWQMWWLAIPATLFVIVGFLYALVYALEGGL